MRVGKPKIHCRTSALQVLRDNSPYSLYAAFAESRGAFHLTFRMFNFSPSEVQLAIHNEVMTLRNKLIAHSDFDMMRMVSQPFKTPMREDQEEFVAFQAVFDEGITFHGKKCDALEELIRYVHHFLFKHLVFHPQKYPDKFDFRHDYMDQQQEPPVTR